VKSLINKINGIIKERGASMWDALLSTNISLTEDTQVTMREFKNMIKSLNLNLSMKEKL
jgi:hypothetical protein